MKRLHAWRTSIECRKFFFHMPLNNAPETADCRNEHAPRRVARETLTQRDLDYKKWMEGVLSQDPRSSLYRHTDETDGMEMLPERPRDDAGPQNDHYRKGAARRWYRARQPEDQSAYKARAIARRRKRRQHGGGKYFPAGEAVYGSVPNETDEQKLRALYADEIAAKGPTVAHVAYGINATQRDCRLQMNNAILPLQAIQLLGPAEIAELDGTAHKAKMLALFTRAKTGGRKRLMLGAEE